jgi:tetratricopeptide (TPR) repeat protein
MKPLAFVLLVLAPAVASAQDTDQVRRLFEAGQYQQVVEAAPPDAAPAVLFTAAQSQLKLGASDQARETYRSLAERGEDDAWHFVGLSGQQLVDGDVDGAVQSADRAIALDDRLAEAHYQRGLALAKKEDWRNSALEFESVTQLNPSYAYAYYYGGLMHYRAGRPDRMANHFEQFLKLAPEAPERPEVLQIMKTVRGR